MPVDRLRREYIERHERLRQRDAVIVPMAQRSSQPGETHGPPAGKPPAGSASGRGNTMPPERSDRFERTCCALARPARPLTFATQDRACVDPPVATLLPEDDVAGRLAHLVAPAGHPAGPGVGGGLRDAGIDRSGARPLPGVGA